ncbi:DnaJ-class molecular chaperone CbpA [hydrothermal vent metagenome]|uniref:DnaJ-class molecular chaperone CbpA n=1 Tax=hydrothermal vent metagenome TaxID=652676 RepID=A0A3B1DCU7_9ZZZZ
MQYRDYYEIMGVKRDAPPDEIKKAYRKLARLYHPDISKEKNAEKRFKEAGEAYEVLKDPKKRSAYDRLGANWKNGQEFHPPPNWGGGSGFGGGGFSPGGGADFSEFFESLFGGSGGPQHPQTRKSPTRGEDRTVNLVINLEDAYHETTQTILLRSPAKNQKGHAKKEEQRLKVKIPKGIRETQRIRLSGKGDAGTLNAPPGDLYLKIAFKKNLLYRAKEKDVFLDLPIAPWELMLGTTITIPTPEGEVQIKIPENSKSGQKLRLKGRGIPGKPDGDFFVVLTLVLPPAKDDGSKALYKKMAQDFAFNPRLNFGA